MGQWNPLIPIARAARDAEAAENDGKVSVQGIRERMWRDPEPILKAVDLLISTRRLVNSAVRTALAGWPAYKIAGGHEHVDGEGDLTLTEYDRIIAFREEQLGDDTAALADLRNRRAERAIREAETVPQEAPTFSPVE